MDEARAVLARLGRIEELERHGSSAEALLGELRALVAEAEAWTRVERDPTAAAEDAVERLRTALGETVAP